MVDFDKLLATIPAEKHKNFESFKKDLTYINTKFEGGYNLLLVYLSQSEKPDFEVLQ